MHPYTPRLQTAPKLLSKRNPFAPLAMRRKAGSHRKPFKAVRRQEKQRSVPVD